MQITVEDIRSVYPDGTSDIVLQANLQEVLGWVYYYAPCAEANDFPEAQGRLIKSLIRRALRFDRQTDEGAVTQKTTGPFGVIVDNRRGAAPTPFHDDQIAILRSLCLAENASTSGMYSVPLGMPQRPF